MKNLHVSFKDKYVVLRLTVSSTGHICNKDIFARFVKTNCMQ